MQRSIALALVCLASCHSEPLVRPREPTIQSVAFAPAPSVRPIHGLAIRWTQPAMGQVSLLGTSCEHAILQRGEAIELRQLTDGAPARTHDIPPGGAAFASGLIVARPILGPIRAIDPLSGGELWRRAVRTPLGPFPDAPLVGETQGAIVLSSAILPTFDPTHQDIAVLGLDRADGRVLFQTNEKDVRNLVGDRDLAFVATEQSLIALSVRDGRPVWRWEHSPVGECPFAVRPMVVSGRALIAASDCRTLLVLDRARGMLVREIHLERSLVELDVIGSVAFVALRETGSLRAIDLETGRTRWESPFGEVGYWTRVIAIDGALLALSSDGLLRAIDPSSGRTTASLALGAIEEVFLAREPSARFLLVAHTSAHRLLAVEPRERMPESSTVRIRGGVLVHQEWGDGSGLLPYARLTIGGVPVVADADGAFVYEVAARGAVRVEIDPDQIAAVGRRSPMGCLAEPQEVYPEEGSDQTITLIVFCPARC